MKTNNYLTTNEFVKKVEGLGFDVVISETTIFIYKNNNVIVTVLTCMAYQLYTNYSVWEMLPEHLQKSLFNLLTDYASTPVDEREEEKKCHWQHRWMDGVNGNFLNLDLEDDYLYLDDKKERWYKKTEFTRKEIDEIKEKYNTDLSDFERVEVEK